MIIAFLIYCIYGSIVVQIIDPKVNQVVISEAARFPDSMTPRLNFLTVDYDNNQQRAKSLLVDLRRCASIINLLHLGLS